MRTRTSQYVLLSLFTVVFSGVLVYGAGDCLLVEASQRGDAAAVRALIAKRADVSVGTVYKHFPSLDELVPACGELMYAITRPPSLEVAPEIFAEANSLDERLRHLVEELFAFYERGASYIETDFQERRLPAVVEWEAYMRATIAGLVREALVSAEPDEHTVQSVSALLDFSTFKSFVDRDVPKERAAKAINEVILCWIECSRRDG